MKAPKISTALSILLIAAAAPSAYSVGDPNIDSGIGSAASRGPYGYNNNNDAVYDTPNNSYGVYRDASGGLRDPGSIPDNLTSRVREQTWEEAHPNRGPVPTGAVGGIGGLGGLAGGVAGFGGGLGLGLGSLGFGLGFPGNPLGRGGPSIPFAGSALSAFPFAGSLGRFPYGGTSTGLNGSIVGGIGLGGSGATANNFRTSNGYLGTPGQFFPGTPFTTGRYGGRGSGFIPHNARTSINQTANGMSTTTVYEDNSTGAFTSQTRGPAPTETTPSTPPTPPGVYTTNTEYNGNTESYTQRVVSNSPGTGGGAGGGASGSPSDSTGTTGTGTGTAGGNPYVENQPANSTVTTYRDSNNAFTDPFSPNGKNIGYNNNPALGPSGMGGGFANPATSGSSSSVLFENNMVSGSGSAGFATPVTSGSQDSIFFSNSLGTSGGFATPQTSGSASAAMLPNTNNAFGGVGFGGVGGAGALGGFPAAGGNRAAYNTAAGNMSSESDTSIASSSSDGTSYDVTGRLVGGQNTGVRGSLEGGAGGSTMRRNTSGFYGSFTSGDQLPPGFSRSYSGGQPGSLIGTMGARLPRGPIGTLAMATSTEETSALGTTGGTGTRNIRTRTTTRTLPAVIPRKSSKVVAAPNASVIIPVVIDRSASAAVPPLAYYANDRAMDIRSRHSSRAAGGIGLQGNLTTDLEPVLANANLPTESLIGRVIGSIKYQNGEIITYGSKGTMRLASDNSASITFNDGEILTYRVAPATLRAIALRSSLIF